MTLNQCPDIIRQDHSDTDFDTKSSNALQQAFAENQYPSTETKLSSPIASDMGHIWSNLPAELRERKQWVIADKNKAPYQSNGQQASSTNPNTWTDFETACAYAQQHNMQIGYVLTADDPFTCIDLDVKDNTPQEQIDRIQSIIEKFESYTEYSQSGKGFHIWVKGKIGQGRRRDNVEVYSQERFIICTGNIHKDCPIIDAQAMLEIMVSQLLPTKQDSGIEQIAGQPQIESDEAIIEKALNAQNTNKFQALWFATLDTNLHAINLDHSQADLSLIQMLAFYTPNNEQLIRLWHSSNLGKREKAKRKDYIQRTIKTVRENQAWDKYHIQIGKKMADNLLVKYNAQKSISTNKFIPTNLLDVMNRPPMEWFVHGVLPKKGLATIYGLPATGKSFLMLDLLFTICKGEEWFGMQTKQSKVAYINLEDIHGMGNRLRAYQTRKGSIPINDFLNYEISINFNEPDHVEELIGSIKEYAPNCGLVCIDTLAQSANGIDENSSTDMGMIIGKFKKLSTELNCLVLIVHHSGKTAESGMRGHSSLLGAVDCAIEISGNASATKNWTIKKSKNGANNVQKQFYLEPVPLGTDEDGNPISSAVVTPTLGGLNNDHNNIPKVENEEEKRILQVINDNPDSPQKEWAEKLDFSTDKMSKQKKKLIEEGYIIEKGKKVTLTDKGRRLLNI